MIDNDIVLEYGYCHINQCNKCPRHEQCLSDFANGKCPPKGIRREILDLMNRLQAENENLTKVVERQQKVSTDRCFEIKRLNEYCERLKNSPIIGELATVWKQEARAEAIKEFAERLKQKGHRGVCDGGLGFIIHKDIDNLVKEMTGDQNDD